MPVTSITGVRRASFTPGVHFSAARSFGSATVSLGSAAAAGAAGASAAVRAAAMASVRILN